MHVPTRISRWDLRRIELKINEGTGNLSIIFREPFYESRRFMPDGAAVALYGME
jgi:hypothetical protein